MNEKILSAFVLGGLVGALLMFSFTKWVFSKYQISVKEAAAQAEAPAPAPAPAPATTPSDTPSPAAQQLADKLNSLPAPVASADCPWAWYSLPGQRLELGDTGFYITFHPTEPRRVYQGHTPEHLPIVTGPFLDEMKKYIEDRAKERAQFAPGGFKS